MGNMSTLSDSNSGSIYDLMSPDLGRYGIADLVHGVSFLCRYGGQGDRFYSVAEHMILTAEICRAVKATARVERLALVHDLHEGILGDVTSPLKRCGTVGAALERVEAPWRAAIERAMGLDSVTARERGEVDLADRAALALEFLTLLPRSFAQAGCRGAWSVCASRMTSEARDRVYRVIRCRFPMAAKEAYALNLVSLWPHLTLNDIYGRD